MSSKQQREESRRTSKNLSVTSKCLAIVLTEKGKYKPNQDQAQGESVAPENATVVQSHNGKELLEDFKLRNKTCYWNPALIESIKNLGYLGFVEPSTILVGGNEIHLENLRTAWGRRVLKAPSGFSIVRIGDVNGIEMQVIPQTQFIPLPDALCLIIMDLNNHRIVATLDTIREKLQNWYKEMTLPNDQLIFDTLGNLIRERKVFHTGSGYFVVTPETYRLPSDDPSFSFNATWLPYHPMYIPVFPQIQNMQQIQQIHQMQQVRAPMRSISCQADMQDQQKPVKAKPSRSQSVRGLRNKEKVAVTETEDTLKRTMSVKYKNEKAKAITKDINLKTSNINQDKEKGEKISLFSKIFGRNKKKTAPVVVKEVEYATFSAQFPPPEWQWYQQQVEKQRRTEEWVSQQIVKSSTWQYLQNMAPEGVVNNGSHFADGKNHVIRGNTDHVLQESNNNSDKKGHLKKHQEGGIRTKKEKTNTNEQKLDCPLHVITNYDNNPGMEALSPVTPADDDIYQSVLGSKVSGPKHSTPRFYDTIPPRKENVCHPPLANLNNHEYMEPVSCHPHHHYHRRSHRLRRKAHRNSFVSCDGHNANDISFEYKGRLPNKNSVGAQSRDSGVNCVGLTDNGQMMLGSNCEPQQSGIVQFGHSKETVVRNRLDNLVEETKEGEHNEVSDVKKNVCDARTDVLPHPTCIDPNYYDSSINEDCGGMQIVCEVEINHRPIPEIVLDTEPHSGCFNPDVAQSNSGSNTGSRDALSSEKSFDTVITNKVLAPAPPEKSDNKNSEVPIGDAKDLSFVDSGFSSPRYLENGGPESAKMNSANTCKVEAKLHKQCTKPQSSGQTYIDPRHKSLPHQHHILNNQRHSRGNKYEAHQYFHERLPPQDAMVPRTPEDLQLFRQQQLNAKRFGLNGEFEVVGVV